MTYVGSPLIYYGDEIGMTGGKDPDCRRAMKWDSKTWNVQLRSWFKKMISIRKNYDVFRRGSVSPLLADDSAKVFGFLRECGDTVSVIIVNMNKNSIPINLAHLLPGVRIWKDLITDNIYENGEISGGSLILPPRAGMILIGEIQHK
jgi:glycosidase